MAKKMRTAYDHSRLTIIDASMQLIAQKGIAETSLADIAKAVKVSKGTLYYYFPSKDHLVHAIAEHLVDHMNAEFISCLDALPAPASMQEIAQFCVQKFLPASQSVASRIRFILLTEAALGNEYLRTLFQNQYRQCRTLLEMGALKSLGFDAARAHSFIGWLIPVLDGICIQQFLDVPGFSGEEISQFLVMMLTNSGA